MKRPSRLWDQYHGKIHAEMQRGSGWWPIQPHPCALEPVWEPFNRKVVTIWDCLVNGWEAPWEGSWFKRTFVEEEPLCERGRPVVLPKEERADYEQLVSIVVEQFPEDESTIEKMEQLLLALRTVTRPVSFEVIGIGPHPTFDNERVSELIRTGGRISDAINGWTEPYTKVQFVAHRNDAKLLRAQVTLHFPNSAVVAADRIVDEEVDPTAGMQNKDGYGSYLALQGGYCFPLRTFTRLDPDPLGVVLAGMDQIGRDGWAMMQVLFCPAERAWRHTLTQAMADPYQPDEYLVEPNLVKLVQEKFSCPLFAVSVRVIAKEFHVYRQLLSWAEQFATAEQGLLPNESDYEEGKLHPCESEYMGEDMMARYTHRPGLLFNVRELASLAHVPSETIASERLRRVQSRTRPAVATVHEPGSVVLGVNVHQGTTAYRPHPRLAPRSPLLCRRRVGHRQVYPAPKHDRAGYRGRSRCWSARPARRSRQCSLEANPDAPGRRRDPFRSFGPGLPVCPQHS